jgi:2,4-dienoyl-CoA reductase-like NADH-dependent reductase (Old Yellow Enzyme family)/thioredoxin reductase
MGKAQYPHLFDPIRIGNFTVQNRVCMVPTDISSANADGSVNQRVITYHEQIAKGGCGFIIVGATTPDKATGRPTVTCLAADEDPLIPGLSELAEAMHRHGARCAVQIQAPGRQAAWPRKNLISASDMVVELPGSAGHEVVYAEGLAHGKSIRAMSVEEIYELIEKYAEAAWRVQQAGFDAVELHAAHGYLLAQFMSPFVNKRHDRFGGSFLGRMRIVLEIIERIKVKCGRDFPIGIRYSGVEWIEGGRELEESVRIARLMEDSGLAFLDISAGIFENPGPVMDPMYYTQGWNTYTAEEVKKQVSIPVITSHTLRDPAYCDRIIREGKTDMIGLARQMAADPYWANKAKAGKTEEIRKCISCLVGCWQESLMIKRHIRCTINPAIGDERFIHIDPARKTFKVAVVGGGPAGMEAARIAVLRGHSVTLFEKTGELGGAMLYCCTVQGKNKVRWYADWLRHRLAQMPVEIRLNQEPGFEELKAYDAVVLAAGSRVFRPEIPGIDDERVITFRELLRCKNKNCEHYPDDREEPSSCGENVLIWGNHFGAADTAERLGTDGKKVYIVTEHDEFASWMEPVHRDIMMKRFAGNNGEALESRPYKHPVTLFPRTTVLEIRGSGEVVTMGQGFERKTLRIDTLVLGDVVRNDPLHAELLEAGMIVQRVGDQREVRNLRAAVTEGANAGLTIDEDLQLNANQSFIATLPSDLRNR